MLELKQITKEYPAGEDVVHALKGIDITFRNSEFVSILGPSGCGKTTLLNIIGGLDGYTSGDLIINGRSTKDFKARDWDTYRNHSVGFVFQSYNLIPHQTVLQNVEIALTLSGVSKAERRERAVKALEEVGLGNQLNKKPNQMSGGQMQRVAIARALVNNPDIILADEPTGALDTETSVQVMEILKKVASDRLVVMVTHNPELAKQYSTRIIKMLDGEILEDEGRPSDEECSCQRAEDEAKNEKEKESKKPSMSFWTAFRLSLKNLFTKKGRTVLTSFAGSIGIIGIALILAVSQGTTGYINTVQEETLATYPITIESTATDLTSLMQTFMNMGRDEESDHPNDAVYNKALVYEIAKAISSIETSENDLKSFKKYLDEEIVKEKSKLGEAVAGVQYSYSLDLLIYTENEDGEIIPSDVSVLMDKLLKEYLGSDLVNSSNPMNNSLVSMLSMGTTMQLWQELLPAKDGGLVNDLLRKQYDVVYGGWPTRYDEIVLVLDENNELDDMSLYILGLIGNDLIDDVVDAVVNGNDLVIPDQKWSYEDICGTEIKTILNAECFKKDEASGKWYDWRKTEQGLRLLYQNALPLKIKGIIKPNEKATSTMLTGTIGYTSALTQYVVEQSRKSAAVAAQLNSPTVDIITGLPFKSSTGKLTDEQKKEAFDAHVASLNAAGKAKIYEDIMCIMPADELAAQTDAAMGKFTPAQIKEMIILGIMESMSGVTREDVEEYLAKMTDDELKAMIRPEIEKKIKQEYAEQVKAQLAGMTDEQKVAALTALLAAADTAEYALYYDEVMTFSESTYERNLLEMGYVDLETPTRINIYASSFANKDVISDAITAYNNSVDDDKKIKYTDYVGLMMSAVTTIINAITYVLIAFVAISLIVSSIMVGVITLISVQERTKEIGILRAIGASKRDVSSMFNAETIIIGFASGAFGVLITYLLCIPINLILHALTGIKALSAFLHPVAALILVAISVLLTLISGIIPSRSAAKKDPVVALRTE
ncbi:MAG: ABC transporter ATP-binding protein/permease [Clostridia bacterium]|nr:ABC transporter ATP-binding protein/permease [Clostridia bacterium]